MAETRYRDRYAQVRQINIHNRSVCYWRNNLSIRDFREERGWYVYEDEGSYNGLSVKMRVAVRKERIKSVFRRKEKSQVEFWGSPNHMGIRVRMKTDLFPRKCCGATESLEYEFEMTGTIKGLSYVNESVQQKGGKKWGKYRKKTNESLIKELWKGDTNEFKGKKQADGPFSLKHAFNNAALSRLCG